MIFGPAQSEGPMCFVEDLDAPVLDDGDRHHLSRVLRVRDGDPMVVSDGAGRWRAARFGATVEVVEGGAGEARVADRRTPEVGVAFALVKGERPELVVQKLTELGVDRICPFVADRSVVRWDGERATRHHERLTRVAREAAMQCRRTVLPTVGGVVDLDELVAREAALVGGVERLARAEAGGAPLGEWRGEASGGGVRLLLVGPEGGWTDRERTVVPAEVGLADHVLRAETAAIVAGAALVDRRARGHGG